MRLPGGRRIEVVVKRQTLIVCIGLAIGLTFMFSHAFAAEGKAVLPPKPTELVDPFAGEDSATVVLAGGCFWCTELAMEQLKGVTDVVSGYAGDTKEQATYELVANGRTDHAEVIQVTYDPRQITLGELYRAFFLVHNPTQLNGQGPDIGRQYRSAVFYASDAEKQAAQTYIAQLNDSDLYDKPIVTTVEPIGDGFFAAEDYHQDYVEKNPENPYVMMYAFPKVEKLKQYLPDLLKSE